MAVTIQPADAETHRPEPDPRNTREPSDGRVRGLALAFMGLAHLTVLDQRIKGALFALVEVAFIVTLPSLFHRIVGLVTLGSPHPELPTKDRDNSTFMMIDGVIAVAIIAVFVGVYVISVRSAMQDLRLGARYRPRSFRAQASAVANRSFPLIGLSPTVLLIAFFVVVPLVFSTLVAFTNYSSPEHVPPANTVDWVGFDNFVTMFGGDATWTSALTRVFVWTTVWAILAVATTYIGGMLLAIVLHEANIRFKPVYRAIFILPYAIPAVVSMLVWRNMLNGAFGAVNTLLMDIGLIDSPVPWLSDPWLAKFVVVMIALWAGFPYFMLLTMGAMTAIPADLQEAAQIDGASKWQRFRYITLPMVLYQTAPLIIMSLAMNFNNFGAIFFLTQGGPNVADTTTTGAGGTDILVSWIYQLTVGLMKYNYGAVIAVMIFLVMAPFAIFNFRRTRAFKGEM
ncbi:sugar ABC transporter permease [Demequina sp. SYSU T00192]|uniref:Maltose/maltodextrin transport system permease protein n=1 Tax=Demequina litoralis TaxID=3051660 RepID=A0ABT8GBU7_9MICO|nr:sugar ABC transporter permease [Demequina sp. SYSU T00192]MDN4476454.1 sugar ABC transporter permease [Demequina sp. SYSU T00192]